MKFYSLIWLWNVWRSFPRKFNLICRLCIYSFSLEVNSFDLVSILETPFAYTFRKIIFEITFEKWAIWIQPFSMDNLSCSKGSDELHPCCIEYICTLSIFFTIFPFARIDVSVNIFHNTLTVFFSVFPISVIVTLSNIVLFSDSVF